MEQVVFLILEQVKQDTLEEVLNPAEDKRSEFHYGRVHGILLGLAMVKEKLDAVLEQQARAAEQREREFDAA